MQSHMDFNEDQVNAFVCDVGNDDLCDRIMPSSIDVITLVRAGNKLITYQRPKKSGNHLVSFYSCYFL